MDTTKFDHEIQLFRKQLEELYKIQKECSKPTTDVFDQLFSQLHVSLEELQVAEEELRQQDEELIIARSAADKERQRFQNLFDFAPDGYLITDLEGVIRGANKASGILLNTEPDRLIGKPIIVFVTQDLRKTFRTQMNLAIQKKRIDNWQLEVEPRAAHSFHASITITLVDPDQGESQALRWMIRDISEQKRAQDALQRSEIRFRTIFNAAELGIALLDSAEMIIEANPALKEMLGLPESDLYQVRLSDITFEEDIKESSQLFQDLMAGRRDSYRIEKRFTSRNNGIIWARVTVSALSVAGDLPSYAVALIENTTQQKDLQAELVELKNRLIAGREVERTILAQDLHDGPLQDLFGVFYQVNLLLPEVKESQTRTDLTQIRNSIQAILSNLRMTSYELRPPALSHYGLAKAILSYVERFKEFYPGHTVTLELVNDEKKLPDTTRLVLFRNFQHAMHNIARHAQAHNIWITFTLTSKDAEVDVRDDGKGFTIPEHWIDFARGGHLGLASSDERADALGGRLEVQSAPGEGTTVRTIIPRTTPIVHASHPSQGIEK